MRALISDFAGARHSRGAADVADLGLTGPHVSVGARGDVRGNLPVPADSLKQLLDNVRRGRAAFDFPLDANSPARRHERTCYFGFTSKIPDEREK
jgi:hypothetical protein